MHPAIRSVVLPALLGLLLASCSSDGDNPAGTTPPVVDLAVSADTTAATTLGTQVSFPVRLTSAGFSGTVLLRVTGAPTSWLVSIVDSTLTLTANGTVTTAVTVTIPSNGEPAENGDTLTVEATSSLGTRRAVTVVTVANEYVVPISAGADAGPHWGAHAGTILRLNVGVPLQLKMDF